MEASAVVFDVVDDRLDHSFRRPRRGGILAAAEGPDPEFVLMVRGQNFLSVAAS